LILKNNTPVDDFCGLTPTEMHRLLYNPLGERSPLAFRQRLDDSTLDHIPFFRLTEEFLREKCIKLTGLGALPRKVLLELYGHKFVAEEFIEAGIATLRREQDSVTLFSLHFNTQLAHLVRKARGRLTLTKEGTRLLKTENRRQLLSVVFATFTLRFGWSSNDGYTEFPVGQYGWGYSIYLLTKFGDEKRTLQFYADKYLQAFPKIMDHMAPQSYSTPQKDFTVCYSVRVFERFLEWCGFVMVEKSKGYVVYDVLGREMAQLAHGPYAAGYHSARWNAGSLASGVYYARLLVSDNLGNSAFTKVTKLLLAKQSNCIDDMIARLCIHRAFVYSPFRLCM
jgi:hypothetical protein